LFVFRSLIFRVAFLRLLGFCDFMGIFLSLFWPSLSSYDENSIPTFTDVQRGVLGLLTRKVKSGHYDFVRCLDLSDSPLLSRCCETDPLGQTPAQERKIVAEFIPHSQPFNGASTRFSVTIIHEPNPCCNVSNCWQPTGRAGLPKTHTESVVCGERLLKPPLTTPFVIWSASRKLVQLSSRCFVNLLRTPKMKELLKDSYPGVIRVREYAGYVGSRARRNRM
jgi:hypothetical protein